MRTVETAIPGLRILHLDPHGDARGLFVETYDRASFAAAGIEDTFVQDAVSRSADAGTVRGLHFQAPPFAQAKLVRVLRGRLLDVAVDLRESSPAYGRAVTVELAEDDWTMVYLPAGLAHGFCTLAENTEIAYKLSSAYSPGHAGGVRWNDPALGIEWPVGERNAVLSTRDREWPRLADLATVFE